MNKQGILSSVSPSLPCYTPLVQNSQFTPEAIKIYGAPTMLGTALGARGTAINKTDKIPYSCGEERQ